MASSSSDQDHRCDRHEPRKSEPIILAVEPYGGSVRTHSPLLPLVYWDDAVVTRGDGVFETLLLREGRACNVERHAQRFMASAKLLDLPEPNIEDWLHATTMAIEQWFAQNSCDAKCVWTYTRGRASTGHPSAWLTITEVDENVVQQRAEGVRVMTSPRGYHVDSTSVPWLILGAKTLNYASTMAALRWARANGFDDVIFTEGDRILEGATSTVITVRDKKIRTPYPGGDILPGTTQAALFEQARAAGWNCKTKDLDLEYLTEKADSVWLLSSVRVATRVRRINDVKLARPDNEDEIRELIYSALG
ncbi:aminodeoxychorismate lyase [Corynebacterium pseudotuberculosis]|uniref:aminodeoxychorismate lyase n=1 Tax=Corynebacterium pseudotuberculosis TaxID=1719 RepID=UPI00059C85C1|nr:aminodeoxychorismate lyase [Corynebacterium pseudotuberculosis]AFM08019.2 aminodeoxychorismate lyase [Corynebacterium pseudotuberculosis Cp162]APG82422.1 4-amino-4-deoxychorismate lyase [Corynebacterium pseudotuberculosis]WFP66841.1 aminodeoxychorismate lyase [Corynebacterium pseudotuberculosis]